ncbi:MAG: VOC family protein [Tessaracoccus sp.]|uniref:VOC family protein n=1 Tax=Tessaracoccus sp. TaxID=1971211 RepID=UPI001ED2AD99|nr:VOC family protein [Tessaracoccus sp.]MBK7821057.1 VOC family protein [Tessaracoccus sp.]
MGLLNHVGITVGNLQRSIAFYTQLGFGEPPADMVFTIQGEWLSNLVAEDEAVIDVAFLKMDDGTVLELLEYTHPEGQKDNDRPNRDVGAMHVALNCDDVRGVYERLKDTVAFNSEPQVVPNGPWAGNIVAYLNDPDGTPVELVQDVH